VIVKVSSTSTQGYDRKNKFEAYRTISTFQEYWLINQKRIHAEQFVKTSRKQWSFREYDGEDECIAFASVPFEISFVDLYNKVKFETVDIPNESID
jgi:Uma2 family endonuclease